jgi:hypothetical protein
MQIARYHSFSVCLSISNPESDLFCKFTQVIYLLQIFVDNIPIHCQILMSQDIPKARHWCQCSCKFS